MRWGFGFSKSGGHQVIAIDFGVSSLKALQVSADGPARLLGAGCIATPDEFIDQPAQRLAFQAQALPGLLKEARFKGRRAVCSIPACHAFVRNLQIPRTEGAARETQINDQLRTLTGADPSTMILRTFHVCEVNRGGKKCEEVLCLAMPRDVVLAHVRALQHAGLEAVGVHAEHAAAVRAFDQITRRETDAALTSLYIDLGYGATKVMIVNGRSLVLAKTIEIGGRQIDQALARASKRTTRDVRRAGEPLVATSPSRRLAAAQAALEEAAARAGAPATSEAHAAAAIAPAHAAALVAEDRRRGATPSLLHELGEPDPPGANDPGAAAAPVIEALADEAAQCVRYHAALFPDRRIDRFVFAGGEARQAEIARGVARALRAPAHYADPFAHLSRAGAPTIGFDASGPQPGWVVPLGLCMSPTDL